VPERVAGTDRCHRDPRLDGREELRQLVRRTVVRDLQHVGSQRDVQVEQGPLRLLLDIAGEEHGAATGRGQAEHEGGVVGVAVRAVVGVVGGQHLPACFSCAPHLPHDRTEDRHPRVRCPAQHPCPLDDGLVERSDLDLTDPSPAQDAR